MSEKAFNGVMLSHDARTFMYIVHYEKVKLYGLLPWPRR